MRKIHVRFGRAPEDRRCLTYAAALAAPMNVSLNLWIPSDEGAERLLEGKAAEAIGAERRLVAERLNGIVSPKGSIVVRHGNISREALGPDGIAVGPRGRRLTDVVSVVPMDEEQPLRRGRGPICVPFGKGGSVVRAYEAAMPLVARTDAARRPRRLPALAHRQARQRPEPLRDRQEPHVRRHHHQPRAELPPVRARPDRTLTSAPPPHGGAFHMKKPRRGAACQARIVSLELG